MTAICPAGPPKLKSATRTQTPTASEKGTDGIGGGALAGGCSVVPSVAGTKKR